MYPRSLHMNVYLVISKLAIFYVAVYMASVALRKTVFLRPFFRYNNTTYNIMLNKYE
jgi:hypothetical protein